MKRVVAHGSLLLLAGATLILADARPQIAMAAEVEEQYLARTIARTYRCNVILPVGTQDNRGIRLGTAAVWQRDWPVDGAEQKTKGQIFSRDTRHSICAPRNVALPKQPTKNAKNEWVLNDYRGLSRVPVRVKMKEAGFGVTVEFTKFLSVLSINYENIESVDVAVDNAFDYEYYLDDQQEAVRDIIKLADDGSEQCKRIMVDPEAQMISRVCLGQATYGFNFKKEVKGNVLNIAIGNLAKLGFNVKWLEREGSAVDCPASAQKPEEKPKAPTPKEDKAAAKDDAKPKVAAKADEKPKTPPAVTVNVAEGTISFPAADTAAGQNAPPSADTKEPKADDNKCYKSAQVITFENSVLGVEFGPKGTAEDSFSDLVKDELKKKKK